MHALPCCTPCGAVGLTPPQYLDPLRGEYLDPLRGEYLDPLRGEYLDPLRGEYYARPAVLHPLRCCGTNPTPVIKHALRAAPPAVLWD
jgi:hypothetical protein